MKTPKTKVKFYISKGEVLAVFPEEKYSNDPADNCVMSYMHIGQHGAASPDYYRKLKKATLEEYANLKFELEGIGYNLEVL